MYGDAPLGIGGDMMFGPVDGDVTAGGAYALLAAEAGRSKGACGGPPAKGEVTRGGGAEPLGGGGRGEARCLDPKGGATGGEGC